MCVWGGGEVGEWWLIKGGREREERYSMKFGKGINRPKHT